jgi:serine protease Do
MFIKKIGILLTVLFTIIGFNAYAEEQFIDAKENLEKQSISSIVEKILPSVVNISAEKSSYYADIGDGYYNDNVEEPQSVGSGFIISQDGYIITNNHVIENTDKIFVSLKGSNTKFVAEVVGIDKETDIAVLKINLRITLPYLEFDTSDSYKIGDQIIVAGNPFNLGTSISIGIISALNRDIQMSPFDNFIQTDAAINQGNSGGPMFNLEGKVIGITSAIYSLNGANVGIGFAIPSSSATPIIEKLKRDGFVTRGWLGVEGIEADAEILKTLGLNIRNGVLVTDVIKDSPAEKSGIQISDVIVSYNHKTIRRLKDLPLMVSATEIGSKASIVIHRDGKRLILNAKISESKEINKYNTEYEAIAGGAVEIFDMYVVPINNTIKRKFNLGDQKGLFVLKVKKDGLAHKRGIKSGDVILSLNQTLVISKDSLKTAINLTKANKAKTVILIINTRNNQNTVVLMPIESVVQLNIKA